MSKSFEWLMETVFYSDGSYRDIYIKTTNETEWDCFLNFIKNRNYFVEFYKDGAKFHYVGFSQKEIFDMTRREHAILMKIKLDTINIHCNFFCIDEIELDIDPNEIKNLNHIELIFDFIREVATVMKKEVILTPENCPESPLVRCNANNYEIEYMEID